MAEVEDDQAEAVAVDVPADAPEAVLCVAVKSVPFAQNTLPISTTKRSTRFVGSSLSGPRSSPADVLVSVPNTNAP